MMKLQIASALIALSLATAAEAQSPAAIRPLGPITTVSPISFSSVSAAVALSNGKVYVNDIIGRRLLLLDSTLANPLVVADTTDATSEAYGRRPGTLIRYQGDSALYIDPTSLSMLVLAPNGRIARVMAVPRPEDADNLGSVNIYDTPAFDAAGHLIYYRGQTPVFSLMMLGGRLDAMHALPSVAPRDGKLIDSGFVVRVDLSTHALDTVATIAIPKSTMTLVGDAEGMLASIQTKRDPLPLVDDWTVLGDGTFAVVRGRDFHVDWRDPAGNWTASPKLPFDWQHVDDAHKQALIDSAVATDQAAIDRAYAAIARRSTAPAGSGIGRGGGTSGSVSSTSTGGRGGGAATGAAAAGSENVPNIVIRPTLGDLPDYMPPFRRSAVQADPDSNLWIRTSTVVNGQPVYDIVNRQGMLVDRVQLPPFRTIAGFGKGVVYMAVKDSVGVVHLERARIK